MKPLGVTMPFAVPDREYIALAKFLNAVENECGVKMAGLQPLDHNRSGLMLEMTGKNCSYELHWQNGIMTLGRVLTLGRVYQGKRERVFQGSPSVEANWSKMLAAVRGCEQRMKAEANLPPADRGVRFDLEALKRNYRPKFDRSRQLRM
jgi:hypothetical protein